MAIVTIVGSGMMGSALAFPARENGNEVRLVGTHLDREIIDTCKRTNRHPKFDRDFPDGVKYYQIEELESALDGADMVIGGVSSFGVKWFATDVLPKIDVKIPVITVTKGLVDLEDGRLISYPEYWENAMVAMGHEGTDLCAIGGPCTSYELVAHDQTEVAFCGKNMETLKKLKAIMATDYYHISLSNDVMGVESAVALKNGYALGITLTVGVNKRNFGENSELHYNSQAGAFGQGVREMIRLIKLLGGADDKIIVGAGDLYVTVYGGRTRLAGILLGKGMTMAEVREELKGVTLESLVVATRVARAVKTRAAKGELDLKDFPLLMHVDSIINDNQPVNIPWEAFTEEDFH